MKTSKDYAELNYNELAFFAGISTMDAKWEIMSILWPGKPKLTAKGAPIVGKNDRIPANKFNFKMRSNSELDGKNQLEYLCDYYNKGTDLQTLRKYSENPTFIKGIKFTGKYEVLNDILNPEQLLKLQRTWLCYHIYTTMKVSDKARAFANKNKWAKEFLISKGAVLEEEKVAVQDSY